MAGSEMRKLVRELMALGYRITMDGHNHWRICDAQDRFLATLPATTANFRWRDNVLTTIRRRERKYAEQDERAEKALSGVLRRPHVLRALRTARGHLLVLHLSRS